EADLPQEEVTQRVGSVAGDRVVQAHRRPRRLRDFGAAPLHVAVGPYLPGQRPPRAEQHCRPDDAMEPGDALAHHVQVRGPQPLVAGVGEAGGREIVDQRVEPDVDRLLGIAGEGDPPGKPLARDRDVLEAGLEQSHDLVPPDRRLDGQGAGPDQAQNLVAVTAQAEEVVLLPGAHELEMWMLPAVPIDDLRLLLELLTAGAIEPFVFSDEDVAWIPLADALDQRDRRAVVAWLRCEHPLDVGGDEPAPGLMARR